MRAFRFSLLVGTSGAVLMALEILSSRILAPHFGNSVYVWGSIISVFLGSLSIGYVAGGRLADRHPSLAALGLLLTFTATFLAALLFAGEALAGALGRLTGGASWGTLVTATVLFGPPSVLFGMVSPWAVRLAAKDVLALGNTAGRLYALSTAGSLAGTLAATFVLIPFLRLEQILGLLLATTAATGALALLGEGRRMLPFTLATLLAAAGVWATLPRSAEPGELYHRLTPYQTLTVGETDTLRYLVSDGVLQASIRLSDGRPSLGYYHLAPAALLLQPSPRRTLMLGLGGGNFSRLLRDAGALEPTDFVEIDPAVVEVAERFMGFRARPEDRILVEDARRFLDRSEQRWDLIFADTYIGRSVPFHLATSEFFALVKNRLTPGGVLAVNLAGGLQYPFSAAIYRTLAESFPVLYTVATPNGGNVMVFAVHATDRLDRDELLERARRFDALHELELPLSDIIAHLWVETNLDLLETPLLTDHFAPVERMSARSPVTKPPTQKP